MMTWRCSPEDEYELDVRHDLYDMGCAKDE